MRQIIVADDNAGIREIFELILVHAGYNVKVFSNGEVLLNMILQNGIYPIRFDLFSLRLCENQSAYRLARS